MHTATWLSFYDELEKIALGNFEKKTLQGGAAGAAVGGAAGLAHGAMKGHAMRTVRMGAEKLVLNPKERRLAATAVGTVGGLKGAAKGLQYGILAGAGLATAQAVKKKLTKKKQASAADHALDVAGLGALAIPTIQKMRGKPMSEKNTHRAEIGGLGVLAAHPTYELAKKGLSKLKPVLSKIKKAAGPMSAMMKMHSMADAAKAATKGVGSASKAIGSVTNNAKRAPMLQSFMATSGHAFKPNPSRAISL